MLGQRSGRSGGERQADASSNDVGGHVKRDPTERLGPFVSAPFAGRAAAADLCGYSMPVTLASSSPALFTVQLSTISVKPSRVMVIVRGSLSQGETSQAGLPLVSESPT